MFGMRGMRGMSGMRGMRGTHAGAARGLQVRVDSDPACIVCLDTSATERGGAVVRSGSGRPHYHVLGKDLRHGGIPYLTQTAKDERSQMVASAGQQGKLLSINSLSDESL